MSKFVDYRPARCTSAMPEEFKDFHIAQEKIDGARYTLNIGFDPSGKKSGTTLLSRQLSTHDGMPVDKTDNIPHITASKKLASFTGTVIDLEIFKNNFGDTISVMGSAPPIAIAKQKEEGNIGAYAFDILAYKGKDIRGMALVDRLKVLKAVLDAISIPELQFLPTFPPNEIDRRFKEIVSVGGEGLIIKDTRMSYGCGWAKMKKSFDVSCVITGFKPGNGKYSGQVGAIILSVFQKEIPIEIGYASGFDDKMRADMTSNPKKYLNKVVDVFAHEISKDDRLRHPTFHRMRPDLNIKSCTFEKLNADFKTAKSERRKKRE